MHMPCPPTRGTHVYQLSLSFCFWNSSSVSRANWGVQSGITAFISFVYNLFFCFILRKWKLKKLLKLLCWYACIWWPVWIKNQRWLPTLVAYRAICSSITQGYYCILYHRCTKSWIESQNVVFCWKIYLGGAVGAGHSSQTRLRPHLSFQALKVRALKQA